MWFLLLWGQRQREKRLGYAADYCPICRKISAFQVLELRKGRHFWFFPVEPGQVLGTTQICGSCGTEVKSNIGQFVALVRSDRGPLESLIATTFPKVREEYREQLAISEAIAAGGEGLDPQTRRRLIQESFGMADRSFSAGSAHGGQRTLTLTLRPLRPTQDEISAGLQPYRGTINPMGRLSPETVMIWIYPELEKKDPNKYSY